MNVGARRLLCSVFVMVVGVLVLSSAPALAAAPEAPSLELSGRGATEVSLRGVLYPGAMGEAGTYEFLYKQSAGECDGGSKAPASPGLVSGLQGEEVFETLAGLEQGKRYTVCLSVSNGKESTLSAPVTLTTAIALETPEVAGLKAEPIAASTATLHGVLNPGAERKSEPGSYEFLYERSASECAGEEATSLTGATGTKQEAVSAPITGLLAHTTYTFCLRATNEAGEEALSAPASFTTLVAAPVLEESSVIDVAATSATFQVSVNPEGGATSYVFEDAPAGGAFAPVSEAGGSGSLPEGTASVPVSVHVQGLLANSAYQFRVVAANSVEAVTGETVSFTTQPTGGELALPDGRQWELVTPPNKHGADISYLPSLIQAAQDGSAIAYGTSVPTEQEPAGYGQEGETLLEPALSTRGPQGWSSRDIGAPHEASTRLTVFPEYQFFSQNLTSALVFPESQKERTILLSSEATEPTPYIRRESLCDTPASASECYLPILTGKEGLADVPPETKFGGFREVEFEGASPDLNHVVMLYGGSGFSELSEWSANEPPSEALQPINVLPASEGGGMVEGLVGGSPPTHWGGNRHSISDDGSRVFWVTPDGNGYALYMRDVSKRETIRLDVQQPGVPGGGNPDAYFQIASSDGSKVFFTDFDGNNERLTPQSGATGQDLYECEIVEEAGKLACKLTDLTPETKGQSAEVARSVLGASEDGSYVYFAAGGVLGDGAQHGAVPGLCEYKSDGLCNLYEYHEGKITFIATLSDEDANDWGLIGGNDGVSGSDGENMAAMEARVSPDGHYLAFMSSRPLTGYDTRDAISGKPDQEVYLYDAVSKRLVCASCDPTGSRPIGVEEADFTTFGKEPRPNLVGVLSFGGVPTSIAANLAPSAELNEDGSSLYQPRALSDGGRLFFNAIDPLVPQAVNGQEDVYEYEPEAMGSCTASSVTFSSRSGGCVSLISSGSSPEESAFLDASEGGGDVFFLTAAKLAAADYDTSYDIYDAHECTAAVPCVASPPAPSPPCDTADSCEAAPTPQPSIYGAPASATFTGAGNVAPETEKAKAAPRTAKCGKGQVRKHDKCVKVKKKKRKARGKAKKSSKGSGR